VASFFPLTYLFCIFGQLIYGLVSKNTELLASLASVFKKTYSHPWIHGAEGQPGQPLGMFQLTRLFQFTRTSHNGVMS
jgi:hypothetical protein